MNLLYRTFRGFNKNVPFLFYLFISSGVSLPASSRCFTSIIAISGTSDLSALDPMQVTSVS